MPLTAPNLRSQHLLPDHHHYRRRGKNCLPESSYDLRTERASVSNCFHSSFTENFQHALLFQQQLIQLGTGSYGGSDRLRSREPSIMPSSRTSAQTAAAQRALGKGDTEVGWAALSRHKQPKVRGGGSAGLQHHANSSEEGQGERGVVCSIMQNSQSKGQGERMGGRARLPPEDGLKKGLLLHSSVCDISQGRLPPPPPTNPYQACE